MLFVLFISGLLVGSFINVLIDRIPRNESILGRSYCENCKTTLRWQDLIPVLSFIYLRARCRHCHFPLSYQYPFVEILTGIMFAFIYLHLASAQIFNFQLIYYLFIVSSLIVIFFADIKHGIIPDKIILPAILVTFVWLVIEKQLLIGEHLLAAFGSLLFFILIFVMTRGRGMGFGDVKFSFLFGLILGLQGAILALYIAFLTGGIIGFILILWKKKNLKSTISFGPFLVTGVTTSLFFKDVIIQALVSLWLKF